MKRVLAAGLSWQQAQAERAEHRRMQPRLTDARLVVPAVGLWCFTALWILAGARWAFWAGALLASLALGSWCGAQLFVRKSIAKVKGSLAQAPISVSYTLALTCLLAALQTVALQARGYPQQWELMQALNEQGIRVTAEVTEARPAPTGGYRLQVETVEIRQATRTWSQRVPLSIYTDKLFIPGSTVSAVGELKVSGTYYRLQGAVSLLEQPASVAPLFELKSGLRDRAVDHLGAERAGMLLGMAYGDDSSLPAQALSSLRVAGLTHLTAVSGANITLIFVVAYRLLYPLWPRRPALIAVGVAASSAYVLLVGLDGSVLRAWVMGLLGALGLILGHGAYRLAFLSTCVMALLLAAPPLATHYGFILSVVATASLLILAPALSRLLSRVMPLLLADLVALPCAASLWCAPVILILSESIYPYTVLANLLAAPLVAPITVLGLLALIGYALGLAHPLIDALMNLGGFLTQGLLAVAAWCYKLPASQLPLALSPLTLGLTLLAVVGSSWLVLSADRSLNSLPTARLPRLLGGQAVNRRRNRSLADLALLVLVIGLAVFLLHDRWPASHRAPDNWQWITCDVGQGDAHMIRTGQQSAYLLDTGDDYSALKSCLDWAGVDQLEAVLITHAHSDHDGALQQVQSDFAQPTLVMSPHYSRQGEQTPVTQGTATYRLAAGSVFPTESVTAGRHDTAGQPLGRVLWPPEQAQRIPGATGSSSWINNTSLVIHWTLPARESGQRPLTVLTTGDLEADAAHRLLAESAGQVPADVLKIAHHGSAGSGTDLIIAASPSLALIPVGAGNSYGHPHESILSFLNRRSIPAARTDLSGHLALTTSDRGIEVTASG